MKLSFLFTKADKILLLLVLLLLSAIPAKVEAAPNIPVRWEYYTGGTLTTNATYNTCASNWTFQKFTVGTTPHSVTSVKLALKRNSSYGVIGDVKVSIRETSGGLPTGTDLGYVTLNGDYISSTLSWYEFTFAPNLYLEASTAYAIVLSAASANVTTTTIMWGQGSDGLATTQAGWSYNSGISWLTGNTDDFDFEVWGTTSLQILSVAVFDTYIEDGDWLVVAEIENTVAPYYPDEDPSRCFSLQLINVAANTTTILGENRLVAWERQPLSIYLNPTKTASLEWGNITGYRVRMTNLAGTLYVDYALVATSWKGEDLWWLDQWVRLTAMDLQTYYGETYLIKLANQSLVLNADGGAIFNAGIAALSDVRPDLFQASVRDFTHQEETWTHSGEDAVTWDEQLGPNLTFALTSFSSVFNVPAKVMGLSLMLLAFFLMGVLPMVKGYAWAGFITSLPILMIALYWRLLDWALFAVLVAVAVFMLVRELWGLKNG